MQSIQEILREADRLHMTYGKYVGTYDPRKETTAPKEPQHLCKRCGKLIIGRKKGTKYCLACISEAIEEQIKERKQKEKTE